ncbi:hypothetical protein AQJ23_00970 [Streptomyces antibioticus]|nr:hypothetical protein AQJ23_00970 [Streptomyces antibioticus]
MLEPHAQMPLPGVKLARGGQVRLQRAGADSDDDRLDHVGVFQGTLECDDTFAMQPGLLLPECEGVPRSVVPDSGHQEETMRKAVPGLFVALAAVLAVAPLAGVDQSETVACCGMPPGIP